MGTFQMYPLGKWPLAPSDIIDEFRSLLLTEAFDNAIDQEMREYDGMGNWLDADVDTTGVEDFLQQLD